MNTRNILKTAIFSTILFVPGLLQAVEGLTVGLEVEFWSRLTVAAKKENGGEYKALDGIMKYDHQVGQAIRQLPNQDDLGIRKLEKFGKGALRVVLDHCKPGANHCGLEVVSAPFESEVIPDLEIISDCWSAVATNEASYTKDERVEIIGRSEVFVRASKVFDVYNKCIANAGKSAKDNPGFNKMYQYYALKESLDERLKLDNGVHLYTAVGKDGTIQDNNPQMTVQVNFDVPMKALLTKEFLNLFEAGLWGKNDNQDYQEDCALQLKDWLSAQKAAHDVLKSIPNKVIRSRSDREHFKGILALFYSQMGRKYTEKNSYMYLPKIQPYVLVRHMNLLNLKAALNKNNKIITAAWKIFFPYYAAYWKSELGNGKPALKILFNDNKEYKRKKEAYERAKALLKKDFDKIFTTVFRSRAITTFLGSFIDRKIYLPVRKFGEKSEEFGFVMEARWGNMDSGFLPPRDRKKAFGDEADIVRRNALMMLNGIGFKIKIPGD
ncbi:MAG: hypothetical protein GY754_09960 [bacterium]|nr:hypothetical protein [bacterium]